MGLSLVRSRTHILHWHDDRAMREVVADADVLWTVSLGKPPHAAIEKLVSRTEAVLAAVRASSEGGAAGFVNIGEEFLQP